MWAASLDSVHHTYGTNVLKLQLLLEYLDSVPG